jgi:hypothetical protein
MSSEGTADDDGLQSSAVPAGLIVALSDIPAINRRANVHGSYGTSPVAQFLHFPFSPADSSCGNSPTVNHTRQQDQGEVVPRLITAYPLDKCLISLMRAGDSQGNDSHGNYCKPWSLKNGCKCLSIKGKAGLYRVLKNVLTAKKSLSLGVLAGKQRVGVEQKALYFALFHVLAAFCVCKSLFLRIFRKMVASKKNRAEKPTVGFCFLEVVPSSIHD